MSVSRLLSAWRAEPTIAANVFDWRNIPARPSKTSPLPVHIHPVLADSLHNHGIQSLYTHQAQSWHHVQSGRNVVVVTGTASGKTLCYNLPVLDRLLCDPEACALYLFPTKALAQDQLSAVNELLSGAGPLTFNPLPSIYDGDTPANARPTIRAKTRLLISNPDMLHIGILPHHTAWAQFFRSLQFIILDEIHVYRGVFGSHVANVLRRLKRIAKFYGTLPRFILTSATIANPVELAQKLVEENVYLVDQDGAPSGPKSFLIYNPPIVDQDLGLRRSALQESTRLAEDLLAYDVQTIIFGRSRRTVELILTYLRQRSSSLPPHLTPHGDQEKGIEEIIRGYRSGYLPSQRREIELGLRKGNVRAVIATNALELGIDIGGIGAALLVGYPGTIAATWQQAGRAGRGESNSLAILIATASPLDQFLATHPDFLFESSPEHALIDPDNLLILLDHLRCAAFELPFQTGENFGEVGAARLEEFLDFLQKQGVLHQSGQKHFWIADYYPAQEISLRSASSDNVVLQVLDNDIPITIGQVDQASAHWMVHPQAIYLHEGQIYHVDDLDLEQNVAYLSRIDSDYYTQPRQETTVQLVDKFDEMDVIGASKSHGEILVTTQLTGYRKIKWYTHEQLGLGEVSLPPTELLTTGYWLALMEITLANLRQQGLWSNDPNRYGPSWFILRERARLRDSFRCQVCGTPEKGRAHDVHHKIPFRAFQSLEQANRLDNLVTLCPSCHRRAETSVRVRSGLAGLAFVLRHLAPFFLMCDVGDLGVHSDPQSPLAEGRPVVVIYDQVPAGIGFSQHLFDLHNGLLTRATELVTDCQCTDGCPSCVGPSSESGLGGKRETLAILMALTDH